MLLGGRMQNLKNDVNDSSLILEEILIKFEKTKLNQMKIRLEHPPNRNEFLIMEL